MAIEHRDQKIFLEQLNSVRQDPQSHMINLYKILEKIDGDNMITLDNKKIKTVEGRKAWVDAITYLDKLQACPKMEWCEGLHQAAKQVARICFNEKNQVDPFKIAERYVDYIGQIKVYTSFGCQSIKQFVNHAIVSDGDKNRQQRKSLFNKKFKYFGSYLRKHSVYGNILVYFISENIKYIKMQNYTVKYLIQQLNQIRKNPQSFIPYILGQLSKFKKNLLYFNQSEVLQTVEGKKAWLECLEFLKRKLPVKELTYKKAISRIALQKKQNLDIKFQKFIDKYSSIKGKASYIENEGTLDPKKIILSLIVSDGDQSRSSREGIFSQNFNFVGGFALKQNKNQYSGLLFVEEYKNQYKDSETSSINSTKYSGFHRRKLLSPIKTLKNKLRKMSTDISEKSSQCSSKISDRLNKLKFSRARSSKIQNDSPLKIVD